MPSRAYHAYELRMLLLLKVAKLKLYNEMQTTTTDEVHDKSREHQQQPTLEHSLRHCLVYLYA